MALVDDPQGVRATLDNTTGTAPTLVDVPSGTTAAGGQKDAPRAPALLAAPTATRYEVGDVLGEGGMGEVRLCYDAFIGRDIAVKVMREVAASSAALKARFLREAQVQARLEHPSVVPIYDLAIDAHGVPYFLMKRVQGRTLEQILEARRLGDPTGKSFTQRRLLAAFATICQVVGYAHDRGVVHRDLKPSNVMIGDYGEVYLLDWGVAKTADDAAAARPSVIDVADVAVTQVGSIVGTLGYMPREQLTGRLVDNRSDIFSLGAILFEILTGEPLFMGTAERIMAATVDGIDARASVRAPLASIAPELDAICVRATSPSPEGRFQTAQELLTAVERYLDGDRDLARRRQLAKAHTEAARVAAERATSGSDPDNEARTQAMQEVGRALALDPTNDESIAIVADLFASPPERVPPAVQARLEESERHALTVTARAGVITFSAWLFWLPFIAAMGIKSPLWVALATVGFGSASLLCVFQSRSWTHARSYAIVAGTFVGTFALTRLFGALILVPTTSLALCVAYVSHPRGVRHAAFVSAIGGMLLPLLFEWTGVLPPSYVFKDGALVVRSQMVAFPPTLALAMLVLVSLSTIALQVFAASSGRDARRALETKLNLQTWQLHMMVPTATAPSAASPKRQAAS
jgi:eukaryotic-like serine/threonine-protein kinase